jgi:hypothetical protein
MFKYLLLVEYHSWATNAGWFYKWDLTKKIVTDNLDFFVYSIQENYVQNFRNS